MRGVLATLVERRGGWIVIAAVYVAATAVVVVPLCLWDSTPTP